MKIVFFSAIRSQNLHFFFCNPVTKFAFCSVVRWWNLHIFLWSYDQFWIFFCDPLMKLCLYHSLLTKLHLSHDPVTKFMFILWFIDKICIYTVIRQRNSHLSRYPVKKFMFIPRPIDEIYVYPMIHWWNWCLSSRSVDEICIYPAINRMFFSQSFDGICLYFTILWWKFHFFHFFLSNFACIFWAVFDEIIFLQMINKIHFFVTICWNLRYFLSCHFDFLDWWSIFHFANVPLDDRRISFFLQTVGFFLLSYW